jgi:hypothetical protein
MDAMAIACPVREIQHRHRLLPIWVPPALIIALLYFALALGLACTKAPWIDEAWHAYPAYNLLRTGSTGSSILEPTGTCLSGELKGIQQRTYWIMPLPIVTESAWFRVFGFSVVRMRSLSIFWGALAIFSWFVIARILSRSIRTARLVSLLLATDFTFLWGVADGRAEAMCVALGSAGLATYLLLRERNLMQAMLLSNCAVAASVFTHPYGVLWFAALALVAFWTDRRRLSLRHLVFVTPHLIGAGL